MTGELSFDFASNSNKSTKSIANYDRSVSAWGPLVKAAFRDRAVSCSPLYLFPGVKYRTYFLRLYKDKERLKLGQISSSSDFIVWALIKLLSKQGQTPSIFYSYTIYFCLPTVCAWGEHSQVINLSPPAPDPIPFLPVILHFPGFWPPPNGEIRFFAARVKRRGSGNTLRWRRNCLLPCFLPAWASLQPSALHTLTRSVAAALCNACKATRRSTIWSSPSWLWFASRHTPPATTNAPWAGSLFQGKT